MLAAAAALDPSSHRHDHHTAANAFIDMDLHFEVAYR